MPFIFYSRQRREYEITQNNHRKLQFLCSGKTMAHGLHTHLIHSEPSQISSPVSILLLALYNKARAAGPFLQKQQQQCTHMLNRYTHTSASSSLSLALGERERESRLDRRTIAILKWRRRRWKRATVVISLCAQDTLNYRRPLSRDRETSRALTHATREPLARSLSIVRVFSINSSNRDPFGHIVLENEISNNWFNLVCIVSAVYVNYSY